MDAYNENFKDYPLSAIGLYELNYLASSLGRLAVTMLGERRGIRFSGSVEPVEKGSVSVKIKTEIFGNPVGCTVGFYRGPERAGELVLSAGKQKKTYSSNTKAVSILGDFLEMIELTIAKEFYDSLLPGPRL